MDKQPLKSMAAAAISGARINFVLIVSPNVNCNALIRAVPEGTCQLSGNGIFVWFGDLDAGSY